MQFYIMTLFPEMVMNGLNTSITGRAIQKGLLSVEAVNIRDYAFNKHNSVDDYPYGGGAGMLMQAEPVYQCLPGPGRDGSGNGPGWSISLPRGRPSIRKWPRNWQRKKSWSSSAAIMRASTSGCWKRS